MEGNGNSTFITHIPRLEPESDEDARFSDEFEEFRARSLSGGYMPFNREQLLKNVRERQDREEAELIDRSMSDAIKIPVSQHHSYSPSIKDWVTTTTPPIYEGQPVHPADTLPPAAIFRGGHAKACSSPRSSFAEQRSRRSPRASSSCLGDTLSLPHCCGLPATAAPATGDCHGEWHIGDMRPRVLSCPTRGGNFRRLQMHPNLWNKSLTPAYSSRGYSNISDQDLHRVRSFTLTSKGLVKDGDLYLHGSPGTCTPSSRGSTMSRASSPGEVPEVFHVGLGGTRAVGKRSIVKQFVKSEVAGTILQSFGELSLASVYNRLRTGVYKLIHYRYSVCSGHCTLP